MKINWKWVGRFIVWNVGCIIMRALLVLFAIPGKEMVMKFIGGLIMGVILLGWVYRCHKPFWQ